MSREPTPTRTPNPVWSLHLLLFLFMTMPFALRASLLVYEGFDYVPSGIRLHQVEGLPNGGMGWLGGWTNFNQGTFITHRIVGPGEASTDLGFPFVSAGRFLRTELCGNPNGYRSAYRQLAAPIDFGTEGIYYVSIVVSGSSHQFSDTYVYLANSVHTQFAGAGTTAVRFGLGAAGSFGGSTGRFTLWADNGDSTLLGNTNYCWEENQAYMAVLKLTLSAEADDTVAISFFGPGHPLPSQEPETWMLTTTMDSALTVDWIRLYAQGNVDNSIHSDFDELRIGTSWKSVTPRPETPVTTYGQWRERHSFASAAEGEPGADPDGDGLSNALEYALGLDPLVADRSGLPVGAPTEDKGEMYMTLTIPRNVDQDDVELVVEVSSDLVTWERGSEHLLRVAELADTLVIRDRTPTSAKRSRFMRVKAEFAAEPPLDLKTWPTLAGQTSENSLFSLYQDVPYLGRSRSEKMDIYLPEGAADFPRPAVLIIHGGGWATGSKTGWREREFAHFMVDQGYAAISINYRLTTYEGEPWSSPKIKGAWADNIFDCKTALRFLKAHGPSLGIDPSRIAVMGGSAGGHLAMLTGVTPNHTELNSGGLYTDQDNSVRCIITFYGIPDVRIWGGNSFLDVSRTEYPEIWAMASPITHLTSATPPMFVTHGTADATVDVSQADDLVAALQGLGVANVYLRINDAPHTYGLHPQQLDLRPALTQFLVDHLEGY